MTRDEAISYLLNLASDCEYVDRAIEALQAEPVKHGKWIEENDGWYGGQGCRCSSCGYGYSYKAYHEPYEFDFCPNCGAKMD